MSPGSAGARVTSPGPRAAVKNAYRVVAALAAWSGLVLQYYLLVRNGSGTLVQSTIAFFSYFTILSNVFAAICLTTPWLAPRSALGRFCGEPAVRTGRRG